MCFLSGPCSHELCSPVAYVVAATFLPLNFIPSYLSVVASDHGKRLSLRSEPKTQPRLTTISTALSVGTYPLNVFSETVTA